jgi:hypothetical protein
MLSARPIFRPLPGQLSTYFQRLLQRMEEESAAAARTVQKVEQPQE